MERNKNKIISVIVLLVVFIAGLTAASIFDSDKAESKSKTNLTNNETPKFVHSILEPHNVGRTQNNILVTKAPASKLLSNEDSEKKNLSEQSKKSKKKTKMATTTTAKKVKKQPKTTAKTTKVTAKTTKAVTKTTKAVTTKKVVKTTKKSNANKTTTKKATYGNVMNFQGTWYEGSNTAYGYSGRTLVSGYSVASNYYPQGTILKITGAGLDGTYRVDDTGGMSNNVVDFFYHYGEVPAGFRRAGRVNITVCEVK